MLYGIAYRITNTINNKAYVGITRKTLARRWICHRSDAKKKAKQQILHAAIRKYEDANFLVEQIASARNEEDLFALETALIRQEGTLSPDGYNMNEGGRGGLNCSAETREKLRQQNLGKSISIETRAKISASVSAAQMGIPCPFETRAKIAATLLGKPHSAERRANASKGRKGKSIGHPGYMLGKKHSAETRAKMSEAQKRRWPVTTK